MANNPRQLALMLTMQKTLGRMEEKSHLTYKLTLELRDQINAHMLDQKAHGRGERLEDETREATTKERTWGQVAAWVLVILAAIELLTKYLPLRAEEPLKVRPVVTMSAK